MGCKETFTPWAHELFPYRKDVLCAKPNDKANSKEFFQGFENNTLIR